MKYIQPVGEAADAPYITGNPGAAIKGSKVPGGAIEHTMREIVHVIKQAGLTPSSENVTQLHEAILALTAGVPAGTIIWTSQSAAPSGYLKANGAAVSRSTYADLFTAISTTFGVGDGSTTFNLPDLRGEFIRGLDDGRGVDASRALGSAQADETKEHDHMGGTGEATASNTFFGTRASGQPAIEDNQTGSSTATAQAALTSKEGGTETRPRNVAGPSPRGRGSRGYLNGVANIFRSIPAWAGEPLTARSG